MVDHIIQLYSLKQHFVVHSMDSVLAGHVLAMAKRVFWSFAPTVSIEIDILIQISPAGMYAAIQIFFD